MKKTGMIKIKMNLENFGEFGKVDGPKDGGVER